MNNGTMRLVERIQKGEVPDELKVDGYNSKGALLLRAVLKGRGLS